MEREKERKGRRVESMKERESWKSAGVFGIFIEFPLKDRGRKVKKFINFAFEIEKPREGSRMSPLLLVSKRN